MNTIMAVVALVLTPVLWILYHSIFRVAYFGNLGKHLLGELLTCLFVSIFLTSIIFVLGGTVLGFIGSVVGTVLGFIGSVVFFLLKWIIILGGIIGVIILAKKIFSLIGQKSHENTSETTLSAEIDEKDAGAQSARVASVANNTQNTEKKQNYNLKPTAKKREQQARAPYRRAVIAIALGVISIFTIGCFIIPEISTMSIAADETKETEIQSKDDAEDEMQAGWLGSFDERVDCVRNGHPTWLPEISYADAYENFYGAPKWRAFDSTENKDIVEFSGECTYDGDPAEVYIQFELNNNDDIFTFSYCSLAQNGKKLELDPSIIIQFLYNPFETYSREVLGKEIDTDTQSMIFDAYMELLTEYEAMNEEDASTQDQISAESSANELLADDVVGTYEGGDDECIVVKSVTSSGVVVDTMMLNEGGVGGRSICTDIELPYMEGDTNQVKFGDDGKMSFSDGSIQLSVNGYTDTFKKTSNDLETLTNYQNEISVEKTESSGNDSRYIWPESLDDPGSYMCSWSSDEIITENEMAELDYYCARIVMNEIYARHGRRFNDQALQEHFDSKIWYNGTIAPENFSDSVLNEVEKQNIIILKNFMEKHTN